jgi:serine/threonine protein kinase
MLAPALEPMSAVVGWWEPTVNSTIEFDVATTVKSKGRTDVYNAIPLDQNKIFDMGLPRTIACQPPSSTDYEYVSFLGQGAFGSIALCIHKQSRRQCAVKIISNAILEEQRMVRAVLAERRIMREASGYPFLLGLLASFHDVQGFYLVSVSLLPPVLSVV